MGKKRKKEKKTMMILVISGDFLDWIGKIELITHSFFVQPLNDLHKLIGLATPGKRLCIHIRVFGDAGFSQPLCLC